jgi:hypothetical protein
MLGGQADTKIVDDMGGPLWAPSQTFVDLDDGVSVDIDSFDLTHNTATITLHRVGDFGGIPGGRFGSGNVECVGSPSGLPLGGVSGGGMSCGNPCGPRCGVGAIFCGGLGQPRCGPGHGETQQ